MATHHLPDERDRAVLALADLTKQRHVLRLQQQRAVLLVLGAPELEHGERRVARENGPHLQLRTERLDDLLEHVPIAARALIVDRDDWIIDAELDTRAQHAVHLVLHLRVTALHRCEVGGGAALTFAAGFG